MTMEVDSPTQHSPIYVDIQAQYRVTFDNMKFNSVKTLWDITVKLEDKKEETILGETNIVWPHRDPPHTICYDSERKLLHWENTESDAYLPIRIPSRPVYNPNGVHTTKPNPKILIRPSFSMKESGDASTAAVNVESAWMKLMKSDSFTKITKTKLNAIKEQFNPMIEKRLPTEHQQRILGALAKDFKKDTLKRLAKKLLDMHFFDSTSINAFIVSHYPLDRAFKGLLQADEDAEKGKTSTLTNQFCDEGFLLTFVFHPSFVLNDDLFMLLLRWCAKPEAYKIRKLLIDLGLPLCSELRRRVFSELDNELIVLLLEQFVSQFLIGKLVDKDTLSKALDLLLFITSGLSDKFLWQESEEIADRLGVVLSILKETSELSLSMNKMVSAQDFRETLGPLPPPTSDYYSRRYKFKRFVVGGQSTGNKTAGKGAENKEAEDMEA